MGISGAVPACCRVGSWAASPAGVSASASSVASSSRWRWPPSALRPAHRSVWPPLSPAGGRAGGRRRAVRTGGLLRCRHLPVHARRTAVTTTAPGDTGRAGRLRRRDGHLTAELRREPGGFGLGQVPARLKPDRHHLHGLRLLLDGLLARRAPARRRAGQPLAHRRRTRSTSAWPAPRAGRRSRRCRRRTGPPPRCWRNRRGHLEPVGWDEALASFRRPVPGHPGGPRPGVGGLPRHRPDPHRGDGLLRRPGQVRHGHGPRRRQHPPVHGHVRRRLQADVRLRRSALHLRRLRGVRRHRAVGLEPVHRPPDPVGAHLPQPAPARDRRRRPPTDRDGGGGHPPRTPCGRSPTWPWSTASPTSSSGPATSTATSSTPTPSGFDEFAGARGGLPAGAGGGRDRHPCGRRSLALAAADRTRRAGVVLVDDGRQPEPRGGPDRPGHHRPRPHDRQHRPARHRRQLHHRPVQRHGQPPVRQHHQPVRRPRLHRPRPPGRGGRDPRHRRRAASPPSAAWPTTRSSRGSSSGRIRGLWVVATNPAHSWINRSHLDDVLDRLDFLVVQDMYATTETARKADLVLPAAGWGEKEGTFINSERRVGLDQAGGGRAGPGPGRLPHLPAPGRRLGLRRPVQASGTRPRRCSGSSSVSPPGRPCDITGIDGYGMLDDLGGIQWPFPSGSRDPS